jgi:hypothetical protein
MREATDTSWPWHIKKGISILSFALSPSKGDPNIRLRMMGESKDIDCRIYPHTP